jgi:hypothetical protein
MAENQHFEFMRSLRQKAVVLNEMVAEDMRPFHNSENDTFLRLPTKPPKNKNDIGVTVTCTALMALAATRTLSEFFCGKNHRPKDVEERLNAVFSKLLGFKWASSGLKQNNAFTVALVIRTAGFICRDVGLEPTTWKDKKRESSDREVDGDKIGNRPITEEARNLKGKTLEQAARAVAVGIPENLAVGKYLPAPSIAYWFLDGVDNLGIKLHGRAVKSTQNKWMKIAQWATREFTRQSSLLASDHQALMDPVSLAMAACVCKRLLRIAEKGVFQQDDVVPYLPSDTELLNGLRAFFRKQRRSGIWDKYFPMFHYPEAGANHCWSFEVLEAILNEFPEIVNEECFLKGLSRSVNWCKRYRLQWQGLDWQKKRNRYTGWNSGGQQTTLNSGVPESWATGAVHMFLAKLRECLSSTICTGVLRKYNVRELPASKKKDPSPWLDTMDSEIRLMGEANANSLRDLIDTKVVNPICDAETKVEFLNGAKRSALLFGPPGTGKTTFVRSIARAIGWDFVEINPSNFLKQGLPAIYAQADEIFKDLHDLERAVVFFDEMDAMVQRRVGQEGTPQLDVEQQFLTTSMLPNLAALYDGGKVLFFVATNYLQTFDEAVTRPGRFDMLLFIGPPAWSSKRKHLKALLPKRLLPGVNDKQLENLSRKLGKFAPDGGLLAQRLDIATIGETRAMFDDMFSGKSSVMNLDCAGFQSIAQKWSEHYFSLRAGTELRRQYESERGRSEVR